MIFLLFKGVDMNIKEFCALQVEEIKKHRWIESEKAHQDLSGTAEKDWIEKYAKKFREETEEKYGPLK
jgi:hypothetical protein